MKKLIFPLSVLLLLLISSCSKGQDTRLKQGQVITSSVTLQKDTFQINASDSLSPVLVIEGENITVDFNGAVLTSSGDRQRPDQFTGTAILIKGKNITLRNATVRGYKVAVMAVGVDNLQLLDCDFSYNYRPRLKSFREREDFADWLSYHQNDKDEWLRYGAAVYLKNCNHALVRNLSITGGMNGLLLSGCNEGLFYNNNIRFNSGLGIGLYRSSRNRIMHNRLDWNVRGYSHGFYQRGQDSAAILVYEQSNENTFAYNSATHSGDGFFLWAGQTTMDSGEGGCNDNLLYRNDFSYAPTNGVEVTFSRNKIIANILDGCTYGIWGGYSYESLMVGNHLEGCRYGIAIEHGRQNLIAGNEFRNDSIGIQLWDRESQPADWGFAQKQDVASRDYQIGKNLFLDVKNPLKIQNTRKVAINDDNLFSGFEKLLVAERPNEEFYFVKNDVVGDQGWHDAEAYKNMNRILRQIPDSQIPIADIAHYKVDKLPDGIDAFSPREEHRGRQYILMDEWGPYNFQYPSVWLRNIEGDKYTFLLFGPKEGNWRAVSGEGWNGLSLKTGSFPATLVTTKKPGAELLTLHFEFIGMEFTDQFGRFNKKGKLFPFNFRRFEKKLDWQVSWYNYDEDAEPLKNYEAFKRLKDQAPLKAETPSELYYAWWGSPAKGLNEDKFATFARADFEIARGDYLLHLTSDDGVRLFIDGKQVFERWDIHEPVTDEVRVTLNEGRHRIEIEHFEGGGFATLGFRMEPVPE